MASRQRPGKALAGKTAVITGGNRGIGLEIARHLTGHGCHVLITGRDTRSLKSTQRELGEFLYAIRCDVRQESDVRRLANVVTKRFGKLDFLINNAGVAHELKEVDQLSFSTWKEVLETNLSGYFLVTHALLPYIKEGGVIVNNLSVACEQVFAGMSAYNAAKFGALGFTNCLREELRPRGIRVTALIPGATETDIWKQFWPEAPKTRMIKPQTVARMLLQALLAPAETSVDVLRITPAAGAL